MNIKPFESKVWLSSPTMHGPELEYMKNAFDTNWMSTVGENINEVEKMACRKVGCGYAVALSAGTAALHMAVKLAGVRPGDKVFCSDMTFDATVNPVVYEGGIPVFIDTEYDTWNMDPAALEKAFQLYPDVKVVVMAHLYGTPGKLEELQKICKKHGAVIIEDAAESLGASYKGQQTGSFGTYSCISFNGNKIITGSSGGMLLTDDKAAAEKVRKWSTQSRENAPWYQHEELGYNYRMSNVIAGVVRGQFPYLEEHIAQKKAIYERYKDGFRDLPAEMNPYDGKNSEPNFWLSCMLIKPEAMCRQVRGEREAIYIEVRLTSFGKMLRSTSLDELPELFNILNGDMSVVGPRPLLVKYLPLYNEHQARRHEVRPGFTGYAQVHGRNAISWEKKFDLDVEYVDHVTFLGDWKIIFQTLKTVLKREGISSDTAVTMEEFKGNE